MLINQRCSPGLCVRRRLVAEVPDDVGLHSVADGFYFIIVTFSTVGYGDISPYSATGKITTCVAILMGILCMAMPLAIVGNNFQACPTHQPTTTSTTSVLPSQFPQPAPPHLYPRPFPRPD